MTEPAEVWPPVTFIQEEMMARGWNQSDLAQAMGWTEREVQLLLDGTPISLDIAERLATAFGTSVDLWLNLQKQFYDSLMDELSRDAQAHKSTQRPEIGDSGRFRAQK